MNPTIKKFFIKLPGGGGGATVPLKLPLTTGIYTTLLPNMLRRHILIIKIFLNNAASTGYATKKHTFLNFLLPSSEKLTSKIY